MNELRPNPRRMGLTVIRNDVIEPKIEPKIEVNLVPSEFEGYDWVDGTCTVVTETTKVVKKITTKPAPKPLLKQLDLAYYTDLGQKIETKLKRISFEPIHMHLISTKKSHNSAHMYMTLDYHFDNYPISYPYTVKLFDDLANDFGLSMNDLDEVIDLLLKGKVVPSDFGLNQDEIDEIWQEWCKLINRKEYDAILNKFVSKAKRQAKFIKQLYLARTSFEKFVGDIGKMATVLVSATGSRNSRRGIEPSNEIQISKLCGNAGSVNEYRKSRALDHTIKPLKILKGSLNEMYDYYEDCVFEGSTYSHRLSQAKRLVKLEGSTYIYGMKVHDTSKVSDSHALSVIGSALDPNAFYAFDVKVYSKSERLLYRGTIYEKGRDKDGQTSTALQNANKWAIKLLADIEEDDKENIKARYKNIEIIATGLALNGTKRASSFLNRL